MLLLYRARVVQRLLDTIGYDRMHNWNSTKGKAYVTSGIGYGTTPLAAFDAAEVQAKIMATNAIRVTSFVPPHWEIVTDNAKLEKLSDKGAFLPMAYQFEASDKEHVAASLVIGRNADEKQASIIMEHAQVEVSADELLRIAKESVKEVFDIRGWNIKELIEVAVEGEPKNGLYVGALVAVLFFPQLTSGQ